MKLAFCFLIYDKINHEEIWNNFFKNVDKNKYNIYIHYKERALLKYFEKYKLKETIDTKYADISLVHASNLLFKKAYADDIENYKFILVSQACIPVKSFDYIYNFLTKDNYGHINLSKPYDPQTGKTYYTHYNKLSERIPSNFIEKGSQWLILNRELVWNLAINYDRYIDVILKDLYAPDEIYYGTFAHMYGLLDNFKIYDEEDPRNLTTFANWNSKKYTFYDPNIKGLKNYSSISMAEMNSILISPCLFARKFNPNCSFEDSEEIFILYVSDKIKSHQEKGYRINLLYIFIIIALLIFILIFFYKKK